VASELVVIGASWGGLFALGRLVAGLPGDFPLPVIIVQHRSRDSEALLEELLQDLTPLPVRQVDDKEPILAGHVYVAPADYHLLVDGAHFSLTVDPPVRFSRPSIDVTFLSAADHCGPCATGVVLTGANDDGAAGLRRIVDRGGRAFVQDPREAEARTMPAAAIAAVPEAKVLTLDDMPKALVARAAELRTRDDVAHAPGAAASWTPLTRATPGGGWLPVEARRPDRPTPGAAPPAAPHAADKPDAGERP
jgi:two-component system, chemotaxis family, protein-glutamate methylesterase/glutaminase